MGYPTILSLKMVEVAGVFLCRKKPQKTPFFIHFRSSLALYSTPCADCRLQIFGENMGKIDFRGEGMGKF